MASRKSSLRRGLVKQKTVGFLGATNPEVWRTFFGTFERRLRKLGRGRSQKIVVQQQWAQGDPEKFAGLAKNFAGLGVDVIVTSGTQAVLAAMQATKTTPIVFASAGDPVGTKLVASLERPGGNVTGLSNAQTDLACRRLDELHEMVPNLKRLAILGNLGSEVIRLEKQQLETRAAQLGIDTVTCDVRRPEQIDPEIKKVGGQVGALHVCTDPFITMYMKAINKAAASVKLPTMHAFREYVEAGGLMSYGPDFRAMFGRAADIVSQILRRGIEPKDIPVELQENYELVVNETTAKALGLTIPAGVRRRAKIIR